jgi:hypothetical protein
MSWLRFAQTANNFKNDDAKTIHITLGGQGAPHNIFWGHVSPALLRKQKCHATKVLHVHQLIMQTMPYNVPAMVLTSRP